MKLYSPVIYTTLYVHITVFFSLSWLKTPLFHVYITSLQATKPVTTVSDFMIFKRIRKFSPSWHDVLKLSPSRSQVNKHILCTL